MKQSNKIRCSNNKNCNIVQSNINIKGDIKCGGSLQIGCLDGDTSSDEAATSAEDILKPLFNALDMEEHLFNVNHNNFHSKNLIIKQNGELYINGEKQPKIPKLFGGEYVVQDCGKVYINGREKKNGEWKLTLRAIAACLFG